ncbi:MAG: hypothetical protein ACXAB7_17360 [Candidatus Kariarchaeaceae archaeon]|jgi:hypothetical protein
MTLRFRHFKDNYDLDLQYAFWLEITHPLPWAWKPTQSPSQFKANPDFDPRSRYFAFENDQLVGYMSFTAHGTFVSLGYPWVKPGYEHLRQQLWDEVYGFASSEFGGKTFLQRFRQEWHEQIQFFQDHGFHILKRDPIFTHPTSPIPDLPESLDYAVITQDNFVFDDFIAVLKIKQELTSEAINNAKLYFASVQFDLALSVKSKGQLIVYFGITIRADTGFAELIAFASTEEDESLLHLGFTTLLKELQQRSVHTLAITVQDNDPHIPHFLSYGFEQTSADVYVSKNL